ncbi:glycine receptor subunit beta-type 4 [Trichonephila clavipes]|nr:glycine receptor subunit beta-type 4 [Trichonephila clavipes]
MSQQPNLSNLLDATPLINSNNSYVLQNKYIVRSPNHRLTGNLTRVDFYFIINNIEEINEGNMDFRLHGYLITSWLDDRLLLNGTEVKNSNCADYIWTPSIIFKTAENKMTFSSRENFISISETEISYIQRYIFTAGCRMFFNNYPFDTQRCEFLIGIAQTEERDISIGWLTMDDSYGLVVPEHFKPLQFFLKKSVAVQNKEGIAVLFVFVRRLMGIIINVFLPSSLIVAVSWVSFWIRVEAAAARVALSITSLLTLCTQVCISSWLFNTRY